MRQKVIAGNWKMNGLINDLGEIVEIANFSEICKSEIILCPPITLISKLTPSITESALHIGAQNCHYNETGQSHYNGSFAHLYAMLIQL